MAKIGHTPSVSVIVPNYNYARFLRQRLESIYSQTYRDFELIILDDCSTDDSMEVINEVVSQHSVDGIDVRIIGNTENSGSPFKQWHKGLQEARGEYIWIAEADDYAYKEFLAVHMAYIRAHDLDLSFCQSMRVDEHGENGRLALVFDFHKQDRIFDYESAGLMMGSFTLIPNASAVVFRKIKSPKCWDLMSRYRMSGDWVFWIYLIKQSRRCGFLSQPYNYFRRHESSMCAKCDKAFVNIEEAFSVMRHLKEEGLYYSPDLWIRYWLSEIGYSVKLLFGLNFINIAHNLWCVSPRALIGVFIKVIRQKFINLGIKMRQSWCNWDYAPIIKQCEMKTLQNGKCELVAKTKPPS